MTEERYAGIDKRAFENESLREQEQVNRAVMFPGTWLGHIHDDSPLLVPDSACEPIRAKPPLMGSV